MTDAEFAHAARDAAKAVGGSDVTVTTDPVLLGVKMQWRGKWYEMSVTRTEDAELDDRSKALVIDAIKRHGTRESDRGHGGNRSRSARAG